MSEPEPLQSQLTDLIEPQTLGDIQRAFAELTGVATTVRDAGGAPLTETAGEAEFCRMVQTSPQGRAACAECHARTATAACASGGPVRTECHAGLTQYAAPITIAGRPLAAIMVGDRPRTPLTDDQVRTVARLGGLDYDHLRRAAWMLPNWSERDMNAAIAFAQLLANTLARIGYQTHEIRQRVEELSTIYRVSTLLASARQLDEVLSAAARLTAEVLDAKAAGLRLLDEDTGELRIAAVYNLSETYLNKGPLLVSESPIDEQALREQLVYVEDMPTDPRTVYPDEARNEGIHSALVCALVHRGRRLGVMRVYTGARRVFTPLETSLLKAVANQVAVAIVNARMRRNVREAEALERQVRLAGDVQRRMIPAEPPKRDRLDIAAIYQPSFELGGDYYDFLEFPGGALGVAIADVAGKGVPASLTMASVRAALRAHARNIYHLRQILVEVNRHLCRDTLINEFVTAFYGVFSPDGRKLTYCNAGHEPVLLLRDGELHPLEAGGMVLGIDPAATYSHSVVDLRPGDVLAFLTDGVVEAMNYQGEAYGRARFHESLKRHGGLEAAQMAAQLVWDVRRFKGLAAQSDDLTLVVVRVKP